MKNWNVSSDSEDEYMNESLISGSEELLKGSTSMTINISARDTIPSKNTEKLPDHRAMNSQNSGRASRNSKHTKRSKAKSKKVRTNKSMTKQRKKKKKLDSSKSHEWKTWDNQRPNYYTSKDIIEKVMLRGFRSYRRIACSACNHGEGPHSHPKKFRNRVKSPQKVGILTKTTTPRGGHRYQQKLETMYDTIYKHSYVNRTPIKELFEQNEAAMELTNPK